MRAASLLFPHDRTTIDHSTISLTMSSVRQRKKKDDASAAPAAPRRLPTTSSKKPPMGVNKHKHVPSWRDWIPVLFLLGVGWVIVGGAYWRYGPTVLFGQGWRDLKMTSDQWQAHLTSHAGDPSGRKLVFIGGPHRGGTTYVWRSFKLHPEVSGFGSSFETGSDESEGIFMQDVYPKMGIGQEFMEMMKPETARSGVRKTGLGRYALGEGSAVHWTEANDEVTAANQARVLNRFGGYWNISKPVLVEKSPPNAILSRFFQALHNVGNKGGWTNTPEDDFGGGTSVARFVFVSRHPIANALAQQALEEVKYVHVEELVENWVRLHEYMKDDAEKLQFVEWVTLEGFVDDQAGELARLWKAAGLGDGLEATAASLIASSGEKPVKNFNRKYQDRWCEAMEARESARQVAAAIVKRFSRRVAKLDLPYDLDWCKDWTGPVSSTE